MDAVESRVNCYSGFTYAQRPTSFYWQNELVQVSVVLNEENTPQGKRFLVTVSGGALFYLDYHIEPDSWQVSPASRSEDPRRNQ